MSRSEMQPEEVVAASASAPALPEAWRTSFILFPFGDLPDKSALGDGYKQLAVADITYAGADATLASDVMLVDLVLFDDLRAVTLLFGQGDGPQDCWWFETDGPGGGPAACYGPFATEVKVPATDFLNDPSHGPANGFAWRTGLEPCDHYVLPQTVDAGGDTITFGTWFSYLQSRDGAAVPRRILNLGNLNGTRLPVLGSYFMALAKAAPTSSAAEARERAGTFHSFAMRNAQPTSYRNPMATQRDLANALVEPSAARWSRADVAAVAPGLDPDDGRPLPEWTDKVLIMGMTIGQAVRPYPTAVFYDDTYDTGDPQQPGRQLSRFYNYTLNATWKSGVRQDEFLEFSATRIFEYLWSSQPGDWQLTGSQTLPGVGYPRKDFPARMGSRVMGRLSGNAFAIPDGRTLRLVASGEMPRPLPSRSDPDPVPVTASIFWWWFFDDGTGAFFSECDFATPQYHDLSIIDYALFERNAQGVDPYLALPDDDDGNAAGADRETVPKW